MDFDPREQEFLQICPPKTDQRNLHDNPSHLEREIGPTKREDQKRID